MKISLRFGVPLYFDSTVVTWPNVSAVSVCLTYRTGEHWETIGLGGEKC